MMVHLTKKQSVKTLPMGYTQTEVGVIPEDWVVCTFGSLVNYRKGFAFKSNDYQPSGTRVIRVSDTSFFSIEDTEPVYVSNEVAQKHTSWVIKENDLIFSTVGSKPPMYDSLVGKAILVTKRHSGCLLNQNAVRIRSKSVVIGFQVLLLNHFRTNRYIDFIEVIYRGNANQASITLENLFEYKIPLPALAVEQTAIANVLSDTDALITELEQLITKKEAIKTATMQQLLTGRTRLPKFAKHSDGTLKDYKSSELGLIPEDWQAVTLGYVTQKIVGGGTPSRDNPNYWGNDIPWVTVKDFATFISTSAQEFITRNGLANSSSNLIPRGTLITSTRIALGKAVIYDVDVAINQDLKAIFTNEYTTALFLFYWFENNTRTFEELGSGSTVKGLSLKDLKGLDFLLMSIDEQMAITTILSDMDAELKVLEQKLAKIRDIKQGMMQQLLTGRIRLPLDRQP
ncbi:TPA: restriction endonuclease subunit S [Klebsiella quasipneumoniae]|uniref:restriction endonuclease subunit S n=1 Tax=Klebsiella quasipneumoniae TaxID=1463165 RepID=UPI00177C6F28|nr:restriction endonuclease subunit S [Klebsiella quasipneumoniae]HEO8925592.1 restriction endonuclease subunit S [Klebsiella aerogenes]MBD8833981.1 restriction endonuclease subunit S [Klebsiella quasipneumoniae]MBE5244714.1 restriction endonuclease subunit S [Klebsiella quasipneumoniae]MDH2676850.1 restriction endonuclease subunit S [Klebsiella quasipneumoniae]MDH2687242.1 restriction endonuclease subunit S [Klebsiella quasipneumoniae]